MAVFMMATYGEGDPTDNAVDFNEKLTNDGMELSGMKYAVFGLGNKTYEHFNKMGKFVDTKLEELGAKRIYQLGVGDDDANLEDDFITWKEVFSEQTTPIKPYDIPINSEFYGEGPLEVRFPKFFHFLNIVIPGIDWVVSSLKCLWIAAKV